MADLKLVKEMDEKSLATRLELLKLCEQTLIHIGGDLSVADIMTAIWGYAIKYDPENPAWEERDRFLLSKGHASAVTSFCQATKGCFDIDEIYREYCTDNGRFGMHSCNLLNPYVDVSTGSLGHGLPIATGIAQGLRSKGNLQSRVYVVMGDGELNEGTMWEAIAAASQYNLGNLIGFVDDNKLSFDGPRKDVMDLGSLADKFRVFGWSAIDVDGHDMNAILDSIDELPPPSSSIPTVVVAHTVKGKGVDFMENSPAWHAGKIDEKTRIDAERQLKEAFNRKWGEK